jgi:hypothetical protein
MSTKKQIADAVRSRLADVAGRGRTLGQALKVRADLAAGRRRLRAAYAQLGEEAYVQLRDGGMEADATMTTFRGRIDDIKAEVRTREAELKEIMTGVLTPSK